jgi:hypothetical protein
MFYAWEKHASLGLGSPTFIMSMCGLMIFMWFHFNLCAGILDKSLIGLHNLLGQLSDHNFLQTISINYWKMCPVICVFACDFIMMVL